jgi:hypothetical protein
MSFGKSLIFLFEIINLDPESVFDLYKNPDRSLPILQQFLKFIVLFKLNKLTIGVIRRIRDKFLRDIINNV